jgi:hypothetical protein
METDQSSEIPPYLPATAPEWALYYKRAKRLRRLGKGQHARIESESKRRRRQANVMLLVSTILLAAAIGVFCAVFGTAS